MGGHLIKPAAIGKALIYKADPRAVVPVRKSDEAAGYDLSCIEDFTIAFGERKIISTGLVIQPPPGFHFEVFPRSGLGAKWGITITNAIGLIDRDYAGQKDIVHVMLTRPPCRQRPDEPEVVEFKAGERIAQLVFRQTFLFDFEEVDTAPATVDRGGLGSTGTK